MKNKKKRIKIGIVLVILMCGWYTYSTLTTYELELEGGGVKLYLCRDYDSAEIKLPSHFFFIPLRVLGRGSVSQVNATKLTIPNTVRQMEQGALMSWDIEHIVFPRNMTEIPPTVCNDSVSLHTAEIDFVEEISWMAFSGCESLVIEQWPERLKVIESNAFSYCGSFERIEFGNQLQRVEEGAFKSCKNLEEVIFKDGVKFLGDHVLHGCPKLTHVYLPASIEEIGFNPFYKSVTLTVVEGSYAEAYAIENGYNYRYEE